MSVASQPWRITVEPDADSLGFGCAQDGILRRLGDAELDDLLGLDLDRLSGLRVAAHAGLAIDQHQLAQAGQGEGRFRLLVSEAGDLFESLNRLLLRVPHR